MTVKSVIGIIICTLLAACSGGTRAPVTERSLNKVEAPSPNTYIVRKGDTLYAIAFRYGLEYSRLARLNNIDQNYNIYPGQRLKLRAATTVTGQSVVKDKSIAAPPVEIVRKTKASPKTKTVAKVKSEPKTNALVSNKSVKQPVKSKPTPVHTPVRHNGPIKWRWPSNGSIIGYYKTKGTVNKGINIAGSRGNPVHAAASGRVVYAGNGLLGYGNLIIIEHNQEFLSAYAHNSRVLVKESDMVKVGQKIAEMGNTGADRVMLHFEIRRDGKPMNPLRYLPKR